MKNTGFGENFIEDKRGFCVEVNDLETINKAYQYSAKKAMRLDVYNDNQSYYGVFYPLDDDTASALMQAFSDLDLSLSPKTDEWIKDHATLLMENYHTTLGDAALDDVKEAWINYLLDRGVGFVRKNDKKDLT